jgi:RNA polymerase sigma-70 factor (ECF subfamily)
VKVLDGRARFAGRSAFKTWLFGVIRRTAMEQARRRWRQRLGLDRWLNERDSVDERAPGPEETGDRLRQALATLSGRQQEVLHLVFYQEMTIEEAAAAAGLRLGTARTHYERGKARLRRLLIREGEE